MKELAKNFDPSVVEERLYNKWMEKKYFHTEVDKTKDGIRKVGFVHLRKTGGFKALADGTYLFILLLSKLKTPFST